MILIVFDHVGPYLLISKASTGIYESERLAQSRYGHLAVFNRLMVVLLFFERPSFPTYVYISLPLECLAV